ncbi:tRNA lysidine(34) synthetase TilS [Noviherbaspirillum agri]
MTEKHVASPGDAFERALGEIRTRVSVSALAVAYSGGLDSAALLHLAHAYAAKHGIALFAFHIHHGLSPNADEWLKHCERECARLQVRFGARRITLDGIGRNGTEQAARIGRYAALGALCREHAVPVLLTAHHLDDQAETVFMQLLRGSGVAGLSGMDRLNVAPELLKDPDLLVGRPLLDVSRLALEQFVTREGIRHVVDESNADVRYVRNALRHKVMPVVADAFPGFQRRIARAAHHAQSAHRMLNELAEQDLGACRDGDGIDIRLLTRFSADRMDNVLRYWLASRGVRMPSTAWLDEMREQLLGAREDAQVRVIHADCEIRRHRGRIFMTPRRDDNADVSAVGIRWQGENQIAVPEYGGVLHFELVEQGIDPAWLRNQELLVRFRHGGEKLKPAPNRPTKSLKHHYQALNVPPWERQRLPVITVNNRLLFAAGIGLNWREFPAGSGQAVNLHWEYFRE